MMDDLDKQLAELQLMNKTELPPNPNVNQSGSGTLGRKVAPAVPPKPKKPQPQVKLEFVLVTNSGYILGFTGSILTQN